MLLSREYLLFSLEYEGPRSVLFCLTTGEVQCSQGCCDAAESELSRAAAEVHEVPKDICF